MINRGISRYRLPGLVAMVCFGSIWVMYQQLQSLLDSQLYQDDQIVVEVRALLVPDLPAAPEFTMPPASRFEEILRRPIFSPTRRPPPDREAVAESPPVALDLMLAGIILSGQQRIAIAVEEGTQEVVRLGEGTDYRGWTVTEILPDRVVLQRQGVVRRLDLVYWREWARHGSAPLIETMMRDPDPNARRQATQRLGQVRFDDTRLAIISAARDPDAKVREMAIAVLAEWPCADQPTPACGP
jgi:hypothetical protein